MDSNTETKRYYKIIEGQIVFYHNKIEYEGMWIFNPTEEQLLAAGWKVWVDPPTPPRSLAQAQEERIAALMEYDSSDAVNSFTLGDKQLWILPADRTNYFLTLEAAKEAGIETIPFMGYTIAVEYAESILKAVSIYAMQCVGVTEAHKDAIKALTVISEVDEYDFTVGYPEKLVFEVNAE